MSSVEEISPLLRVTRVEKVAAGIVRARLETAGLRELPSWEPGAHIEVRLASGLIRHYSLCGDPGDATGYEIAVQLETEGRGGSREFHASVRPGTELTTTGQPRNNFPLEPADRYLFLAGGVGITPLLPMVRRAHAVGADWRLVYGGRSRSAMAFIDQVLDLDPARVSVFADDDNGRPDLSAELKNTDESVLVYACGPGPMLDTLSIVHAAHGHPGTLRMERFGAEGPVDRSGASFEVVAQRSGVTVPVGPEESILDALRSKLDRVPFSCEDGYCGTCETLVVEGVPDHRDTYLDDDEREVGETMMICVSRSNGPRLVLDV